MHFSSLDLEPCLIKTLCLHKFAKLCMSDLNSVLANHNLNKERDILATKTRL